MTETDLIDLLCCPVTHQPLREASPEELEAFGSGLAIDESAGTTDREASAASCPCVEIQQDMGKMPKPRDQFNKGTAAALIREDGLVLYPVRNGIPQLLPGEAIPLTREPSPR